MVIDMKPCLIYILLLYFSTVPQILHAEDESQVVEVPKVRG